MTGDVMNANEALKAHAPLFKYWHKGMGSKPTGEALAQVIGATGARPGKQAFALAMYARPEGATNGQVVQACGAPQLNKMRESVARGVLKRDMGAAPNDAGHTVYRVTLTAKGEAAIKRAADKAVAGEGDAKPAKRKAADKGKSSKRKPATETRASDQGKPAEPVNAPVSGEGSQAAQTEPVTA